MMRGELYADFALLWLVCHQSRVESELPHECWLEGWSREAAEQGVRALDALRDGVREAIEALGQGFLAHRANTELKTRLQSGELSAQDYSTPAVGLPSHLSLCRRRPRSLAVACHAR